MLTSAYHFWFDLFIISTANQNTSLRWSQPELSIHGAGQEDRSSGNEKEHFNKMVEAVIDFDTYIDIRFHLGYYYF